MSKNQRRTIHESIEQIFNLLQKDSPQTLSNMCADLNLVWKQANTYINLITYIQNQPKLKDQKLGSRTRVLSIEREE